MNELPAVFLLRALQALALSMPTLLAGMITAGFIAAAVGPQTVRRFISSSTWRDLPAAILIGWLLPVCSFGVLPVAGVLMTMGVRPGAVVALTFAAPWITPWSLGYLADTVGLPMALVTLATSFVLAWAAGYTTDWLLSRRTAAATPQAPDPPLQSSLAGWAVAAGRSLTPGCIAVILLSAACIGAVAAAIPPNAVGDWLVDRSMPNAALLTLLGLVSYPGVERGVMQVGEILIASTMPGLVVTLGIVGASVHPGLIVAGIRRLGVVPVVAALAVVMVGAINIAIVVDNWRHVPGYVPEDTHSFEDFGRPFHLLDHDKGALQGFVGRFVRPIPVTNAYAAVAIAILWAAAWLIGRRGHSRPPPAASPVDPPAARSMSASLPPARSTTRTALGGVALLAALTAVLSVYSYWPPPAMIRAEVQRLSADWSQALLRDDRPSALRAVAQIDRRLSQLAAASTIRGRPLTAAERQRLTDVRATLARMGQQIEAEPSDDVLQAVRMLRQAVNFDGSPGVR